MSLISIAEPAQNVSCRLLHLGNAGLRLEPRKPDQPGLRPHTRNWKSPVTSVSGSSRCAFSSAIEAVISASPMRPSATIPSPGLLLVDPAAPADPGDDVNPAELGGVRTGRSTMITQLAAG